MACAPAGPVDCDEAVRKNGCRTPDLVLNVTGFTHATCCVPVPPCPESRLTPLPARPKSEFAGGVVPKEEYAMTQPVAEADRQVGMLRNVPPTVLPGGTCTLPPSRMAETMRLRSVGEGSTWVCSNLMSMEAPWECPMKMTGLPWLSWAR
jgi:hypothetical protein